MEAAKEEIKRIKEEEEQAMREALGLAPKRASRPQGNRLDKQEFSELVKRGSTAEDMGAGHAEAASVQGLGFARYIDCKLKVIFIIKVDIFSLLVSAIYVLIISIFLAHHKKCLY